MSQITLTLKNKTKQEITFTYNDKNFSIQPKEEIKRDVESGHQGWLPPQRSFDINEGVLISEIENDCVVEFELDGEKIVVKIK